ncbi:MULTISPECIES: cbb3-type cytochrome oxidase assembly protein CcoS [Aliagarivorans]|uniref:cbb3-type cytochrome oxidase assembly protein CcoS n=1 Tax=Aliagarivorans TaxID=882379 RepID=UPI00041D909A|nr:MULTISPECIES: cbb3-type cytochrome oxidase assembly protein CcoS [Aliagarivorans]
MSIIFILIPIALVFVAIGIGVFFWAVNNEQFEDLDRQASNILFEEKKEDDEQ